MNKVLKPSALASFSAIFIASVFEIDVSILIIVLLQENKVNDKKDIMHIFDLITLN